MSCLNQVFPWRNTVSFDIYHHKELPLTMNDNVHLPN